MISSFVWLILLQMNYIHSDNAPWKIYIPIVIIEIIVYLTSLPKIADMIDELGE